jgi:hypothetical protein
MEPTPSVREHAVMVVSKCEGCNEPQWSDGQSFCHYGSHRPRCPWV